MIDKCHSVVFVHIKLLRFVDLNMMDGVRIQLLLFFIIIFKHFDKFSLSFPPRWEQCGYFLCEGFIAIFFLSKIEDFFFSLSFFIARMNEHRYIL